MRRRNNNLPVANLDRRAVVTALLGALGITAFGQQNSGSSITPASTQKPVEEDDVIRTETRLVVLHASVTDKNGNPVASLKQTQFKVYENAVQQPITVFRREDVPLSLGLIIDDSGSMRDARERVEAAALSLVKSSTRNDEVFVVNFSDVAYLDVPFTADIKKLEEGIARRDSRGGTAMREALNQALTYVNQEASKYKRVLLVVTDGDDNSSETTLERLVAQCKQSEVLVYAIGLLSEANKREARRAKRAMDELAESTGGLAYYP
jgi:Ca-activated chloride channel homolog